MMWSLNIGPRQDCREGRFAEVQLDASQWRRASDGTSAKSWRAYASGRATGCCCASCSRQRMLGS